MAFAHSPSREPPDIEPCVAVSPSIGVSHGVSVAKCRARTLADANESQRLGVLRRFRAGVDCDRTSVAYACDLMGVDLDQSLYALDSTTIDLCLSLFPWAKFRQRKARRQDAHAA